MKIQFNPDLGFQKQAIDSITGIFEGQETCQTNFTVAPLQNIQQGRLFGQISNLGIGNRLKLLDEDILTNLKNIQLKNGLAPSQKLDSKNFTVEMETGTGKTYVYLRSIFELNRLYGFTKFIIVVPSIAIKEGVYKSLQITETHFRELYGNQCYEYFVYNSGNLSQVRNFATSPDIQIMVINIDAFRRSFSDPAKENKANIIHRYHDKMTGAKPIEYIQETNPIVIIDEPQSVATTSKSKEAIASLNPLCTLRYSATHVEKHHMLYKLDSVDAYEQKLVKQIEVAGIEIEDSHNKPYIKLLKVDNKKSPIKAKLEIDCRQRNGNIKRKPITVRSGHDLLEKTGGRDIYDGYIIEEIYCEEGNEYVSFTSQPDIVKLGQAIGEADKEEYQKLQIKKTIEEHLDKEMRLRPRGIKVLSLFFIDRVANYKFYDKEGNPQKGKFACIFEEEYKNAIRKPKYKTLFEGADIETAAEGVHNGYFAIDKKKDTKGKGFIKDTTGKSQADESAYNLIMKDKERLLSFDSKLKFIFSHSALKEGWDNPNVFQICTLNETTSKLKKRQEIGRGLRIAVNQDGERVHGFEVNTLTVMANESYEKFAEELQREIEEEGGIKFGVVEKHLFASIVTPDEEGNNQYLGAEKSKELWDTMKVSGYIDNKGKVQDKLKEDLKNDQLEIPEEYCEQLPQVKAVLRKVAGKLNIKNAKKRREVKLNKAVYLSEDFKALWDKIKYQTTYRVEFSTDELVKKCVEDMQQMSIGQARFVYQKARAEIDRGGVHVGNMVESSYIYDSQAFALPDIITYLQNETNLTRTTIVRIINESGRLNSFKSNPQKFIEKAARIIKHQMQLLVVEGIKYQKIGDKYFFEQKRFEDEELRGYLEKNMVESHKSVFDHVIYDSGTEMNFAKAMEQNSDIKLYAKLPDWFKIDTPLGSYNPDWAVVVEKEGVQKLFFVVETKGEDLLSKLPPDQKGKFKCGKAHFQALDPSLKVALADNIGNLKEAISDS